SFSHPLRESRLAAAAEGLGRSKAESQNLSRSPSMLDRDVGEELLKLDLSPKTEAPANQIERILDADRRRVRRWTRVSIALWILAGVGAVLIFVIGGMTFPVIAKLLAQKGEGTLENPDTPFLVLAKLTALCLVFGAGSFLVLVCAGLATVLLLVRTRGATL